MAYSYHPSFTGTMIYFKIQHYFTGLRVAFLSLQLKCLSTVILLLVFTYNDAISILSRKKYNFNPYLPKVNVMCICFKKNLVFSNKDFFNNSQPFRRHQSPKILTKKSSLDLSFLYYTHHELFSKNRFIVCYKSPSQHILRNI